MDFERQVNFKYPVYQYKIATGLSAADYTYYMIPTCTESSSTFVQSTQEWLRFLSDRVYFPDSSKYEIKKMARLPMTLFYTATVLVAGSYLTIYFAKTKPNPEAIAALLIGTVGLTLKTYNAGMAPDMRYWTSLPQAIIISTHDISPYYLSCLAKYKDQSWFKPRRFL